MINKSLEKSILHQKVNTVLKLDMKSNCSIQTQCKDYKLAYKQDSQENKTKTHNRISSKLNY